MSADRGDPHAARSGPFASSNVRLLDLDPELGSELEGKTLTEARRELVLPTVSLPTGGWGVGLLGAGRGVKGVVYGFITVHGAVTIELTLAGRRSARLILPGEVVLLEHGTSETLPVRRGWTALEPSRLAVLDVRLLAIARRWPPVMAAILRRAAEQTRYALLQQAIVQIPRVEERLLGLLWSIADRRGVVRGDGVWVYLPVTHETLAHMIGARRPTVSLGLKALQRRGAVAHVENGWLLTRASLTTLSRPRTA
jgi:CRP/FNR family transcriptional regulator, cyclic AMP receptor protein